MMKFEKLGFKCPMISDKERTFAGIGSGKTKGVRRFPVTFKFIPKTECEDFRISGILDSHELVGQDNAMLVSLQMQAHLAVVRLWQVRPGREDGGWGSGSCRELRPWPQGKMVQVGGRRRA